MCFIYSELFRFCFSLRRDTADHKNIQLLSFFSRGKYYFFINVYSNNFHTTMKFLSNKALNISKLFYIAGNFNVRDTE